MSTSTVPDEQLPELPCHVSDPDLWFADSPSELERAKALCADCPIRRVCLAEALERAEPWGVWGGEILDRGCVVNRKRPRGRPRKDSIAAQSVGRCWSSASLDGSRIGLGEAGNQLLGQLLGRHVRIELTQDRH